jgi:probable phosphoglycerate mutase
MTIFGMIRHGSTEWNQLGKLQGQQNIPLSQEGNWQAEQLGKRLLNEKWDFIISSDLERALETARTISDNAQIPLRAIDVRLRERSFGLLEGTTLDERLQNWGDNWQEADVGKESDDQVWARWLSMYEEAIQAYEGSRILVVTHGSFIGTVLKKLGLDRPQDWLTNASLTEIHVTDGQWECSLYNCTTHLK